MLTVVVKRKAPLVGWFCPKDLLPTRRPHFVHYCAIIRLALANCGIFLGCLELKNANLQSSNVSHGYRHNKLVGESSTIRITKKLLLQYTCLLY